MSGKTNARSITRTKRRPFGRLFVFFLDYPQDFQYYLIPYLSKVLDLLSDFEILDPDRSRKQKTRPDGLLKAAKLMISKYRTSLVSIIMFAAFVAFLAFILPTQPNASAQLKYDDPAGNAASQVQQKLTLGDRTQSEFFGDSVSIDNDFFFKSLVNLYRDHYVPQATGSSRFKPAQSRSSGGKTDRTESYLKTDQSAVNSEKTTIFGLLKKGPVDTQIDQAPIQRDLRPDVMRMIGPVSQDKDLRDLPYMPPSPEKDDGRLMRHSPDVASARNQPIRSDPVAAETIPAAPSAMPTPIQTFAGMSASDACGGCQPPDTDGDVGPNHYMQTVNSSIRIFDKTGTSLSGPTTYNSFFSALGAGTPCGNNQNDGDGVIFYDHIADRWIVSDFAFPAFPGTSFYQCIGVSKTSNPVSGGYWLYAVQVDPSHNNYLGDYPKFGMWPDAYYMTVNEFSNNTTFNGVRVYAFDRSTMINGGAANTIAFSVLPADLGDQYSFVPASFRTGNAPPAGQPEWVMSVNSSAIAGTVETQVFVRRFHVDFATPANSTFGVGASHAPDGIITVNGFVGAFTSTTSNIVPNGTTSPTNRYLDTLGDKLMYPLIYQNRGATESIYGVQTVNNNQGGTGPTGIRWYQFNMTGNTIPATPTQQQTFTNGNDGLWRWMPSINVDRLGNVAIGYSVSSTTLNPEIRYAGRLASDPLNNLSQGEAVMTTSAGHQTSTFGRWGDYSTMFVDPNDGCTFFHTNEYYTADSTTTWSTRVGSFKFAGCIAPTAGSVSVSGRVLTPDGRGLRNAKVLLTDPHGIARTVTTSSFGFFQFDEVGTGESYVIGVLSKQYRFASQLIQVDDALADITFVGQE